MCGIQQSICFEFRMWFISCAIWGQFNLPAVCNWIAIAMRWPRETAAATHNCKQRALDSIRSWWNVRISTFTAFGTCLTCLFINKRSSSNYSDTAFVFSTRRKYFVLLRTMPLTYLRIVVSFFQYIRIRLSSRDINNSTIYFILFFFSRLRALRSYFFFYLQYSVVGFTLNLVLRLLNYDDQFPLCFMSNIILWPRPMHAHNLKHTQDFRSQCNDVHARASELVLALDAEMSDGCLFLSLMLAFTSNKIDNVRSFTLSALCKDFCFFPFEIKEI